MLLTKSPSTSRQYFVSDCSTSCFEPPCLRGTLKLFSAKLCQKKFLRKLLGLRLLEQHPKEHFLSELKDSAFVRLNLLTLCIQLILCSEPKLKVDLKKKKKIINDFIFYKI